MKEWKDIKIKDITDLTSEDMVKLNTKEITVLLSKANFFAKTRIKRFNKALEKENLPASLAYREWFEVSDKTRSTMLEKKVIDKNSVISYKTLDFSIKDGDKINDMRYKLKRVKNFLSTKTSTIQGLKSTVNTLYKNLFKENKGLNEIKKLNPEEYKNFWELYSKIVQNKGAYEISSLQSSEIQRLLYYEKTEKGLSFETIEENLRKMKRIKYDKDVRKEISKYYGGGNI